MRVTRKQYIEDNFPNDRKVEIYRAIRVGNTMHEKSLNLAQIFKSENICRYAKVEIRKLIQEKDWKPSDILNIAILGHLIDKDTKRHEFIMGQFIFKNTREGQKYWHDYVLELKAEDRPKTKTSRRK